MTDFPSDVISKVQVPPYFVEEGGVLYESDYRSVLTDLPINSIDLIVTDPPYGINYRGFNKLREKGQKRNQHNLIVNDSKLEALNLLESLLRHAARLLKPGGCLCCCAPTGGRHSSLFGQWIRIVDEHLTLKEIVVWDKNHIGLGGHYRKCYEAILVATKPGGPCKWHGEMVTSNIFRHPRIFRRSGDHPTPKPEALMGHFIELHSDPGDIVLDPFAGHGSTLVASQQRNRKYLGVELISEYCAATAVRLEESQI